MSSSPNATAFSEADEVELLALLEFEEREDVAPKLEAFRNPSIGGDCPGDIRIKGCRGGRGAGAKSWSLTSLIVQRAQYEKIRVACLREIQQSLEESVYELIRKTVERIGYSGWKFTKEYIESPTGSHFIFRGLKDLRAASQIKGLEGFDVFFVEEAATVSKESWDVLMPTLMRTPGAELWFAYNPEEEIDPVAEKIWNRNRPDALCIDLLPGKADNPWWNEGLQTEMEQDFEFDPDEAEHIWYGLPRKQGASAVIARASIRAAMDRTLVPEGGRALGVDVARFGDDLTVIADKVGLTVKPLIVRKTLDTQEIAKLVWFEIINRDPSVPVRVDDSGVGGGVTDRLREFGAKIVPVNFGENAVDHDRYANAASEMYFTVRELIDELDLPDDPELMRELSGRRYGYDRKERRQIESKDEFKRRLGRSPDRGDAVILACYAQKSYVVSEETRRGLANRRRGA